MAGLTVTGTTTSNGNDACQALKLRYQLVETELYGFVVRVLGPLASRAARWKATTLPVLRRPSWATAGPGGPMRVDWVNADAMWVQADKGGFFVARSRYEQLVRQRSALQDQHPTLFYSAWVDVDRLPSSEA